MPILKPEQPIGIFDSGIGGLTIARAIHQLLPNEDIVYFGDTAHLPYGDKSAGAIQYYSSKISEMLLSQHCKMIVIACHTASSVAYDIVKQTVDGQAYLINMIDPTIRFIAHQENNQKIGLIGTYRTIQSNIYKKKIDELKLNIDFVAYPTPLLAAAIEDECNHPQLVNDLLKTYLHHPSLTGIDALILGCTHYPVVKDRIYEILEKKVKVIDTSELVAEDVRHCLAKNYLLHEVNEGQKNRMEFYVSDYTTGFENATQLFFGHDIRLAHYPLWS